MRKPQTNYAQHRLAIERMCLDGASLQEIADALGSDRSGVGKFLKREGIHRTDCRLSRPRSGEANGRWRGGVNLTTNGYLSVRAPDHPWRGARGYVYEHRLVMENYLDRLLEPSEIVHHRNENRLDNRVCNLQVFSGNKQHLSEHRRMRRDGPRDIGRPRGFLCAPDNEPHRPQDSMALSWSNA